MNYADHMDLQAWIRQKDADAFKDLTVKYSGMVYGTCLRITRNRSDAEDVTQECFETLARVENVPRTPLGAWLHKVATNRALDRIKTGNRRKSREARFASEKGDSSEIKWNDIEDIVDELDVAGPVTLRQLRQLGQNSRR